MSTSFVRSPMNYTGNKFKLLPQITKLFPSDIDTFIDMFCGGLDVSLNTTANRIIANDLNYRVIELYQYIHAHDIDDIIGYIEFTIDKFQLTRTDKDAYIKFREYYNTKSTNPLDLFVLKCYSFNNMIESSPRNPIITTSFGRRAFNKFTKVKLTHFKERLYDMDITFLSKDFLDLVIPDNSFVYADPPYLISRVVYGHIRWNNAKELSLYQHLDELNERNIKFALSNIMVHKNMTNDILKRWSGKYNVHPIEKNYIHCASHNRELRSTETQEVLVTNY